MMAAGQAVGPPAAERPAEVLGENYWVLVVAGQQQVKVVHLPGQIEDSLQKQPMVVAAVEELDFELAAFVDGRDFPTRKDC